MHFSRVGSFSDVLAACPPPPPILRLVCSAVFQNFLGYRTVLVLFVTILFHTNGLRSCPVRSFFVRTFLLGNLWYVFSRVYVWFV